MKNKKHFVYFVKDHLWIVGLFMAGPIGFYFLYGMIAGFPIEDFWYYFFLENFIMLCGLVWRYYVTYGMYEQLCSEAKEPEEYFIAEPKCNQEIEFQKLLRRLQGIYKIEQNSLMDDKKNQKFMMYQWVHQIKTPLSVIKLIAENHEGEEDYGKIGLSVKQMQYNLDQILNVYQLDAMENNFKTEKIELYEICKRTVNELKEYFITNKVFPRLEISKELYVYSDSKWLRLIIYQLLTNAIKYSNENGKITLSGECVQNKVTLSVMDEGCGIKKEDYDRIFDLFFVGDNGRKKGESSGIGLYLVKKIAFFLEYEIQVESNEGSGCNFKIIFK